MTTDKLPSGKWRTRIFVNGKQISFTAYTKAESVRLATQAYNMRQFDRMTVLKALQGYLTAKKGVLSPNTLREYENMVKRYYEGSDLAGIRTDKLTAADIQKYISDLSEKLSPKSVSNIYGLLTSALKLMCNGLHFNITLPKIPPKTYHIPTEDDFKMLVDMASPNLKKAILLSGIGSVRRGEIAAAIYGDIENNRLHIQRDMVLGSNNTWIVKKMPKNSSSDRYIDLPEQLMDILGTGQPDERIVPVLPSTITSDFINLRNRLQLQCRFHDLRHYYVSLAHSIGVPDRVIMARAGFSSDRVMKAVYRNQIKADEEVYNDLWNDYMMKKLQKK